MSGFQSLKSAATAAALFLSAKLPAEEPGTLWQDLNKGIVPESLSYQQLLMARYEYLGFKDSEIPQVLAAKEKLRLSQTDWPTIQSSSGEYKIQVVDLPEGLLGRHSWPVDQIQLSRSIIKSEHQPSIAQILSEEFLHAVQFTSWNVNDMVFAGKEDSALKAKLKEYQDGLLKFDQEIKKISPELLNLSFHELSSRSSELLDKSMQLNRSASDLTSDFILDHVESVESFMKMPVFGIDKMIEFVKGYSPPSDLLKSLEQLQKEKQEVDALLAATRGKTALMASCCRYLINNYYTQIKIEIDPRLSDIGFAWMQSKKMVKEPVQAILQKGQAKEAFEWFMKQSFAPGSVFDLRQIKMNALLEKFKEKEEKEKLLEALYRRMTGLARVEAKPQLIG